MKDDENGELAVSGDDVQIQAWICGVLILLPHSLFVNKHNLRELVLNFYKL